MARDREIIKSIKKLKLVPDHRQLAPEEFEQTLDPVVYAQVMSKLTGVPVPIAGMGTVEMKIPLSCGQFFTEAEALLGNFLGLEEQARTEREEKDGPYTNGEFFQDVLDLLKEKTKKGPNYLELLCMQGVFSDYNAGKKVPEIMVFDGKTQPIFDYAQSIVEKIYVETPLDTDQDGKRDLIAVYIRRPAETEQGMKVPVIYVANPYMMGCNEDDYHLHDVDQDLAVIAETQLDPAAVRFHAIERELPEPREILGETAAPRIEEPEFEAVNGWYKYLVTRGYAVVLAGGIGTLGSDGVRFCGSEEETISTIAVIDWLNGRLPGFSNKEDHLEVKAAWCSGSVGMTGKSYLGTLAVAAATTGVEGLKTIVPEAAICNWYDYYRSNGLNVPALGWQGDDADLLAEYCFSRRLDAEDDSQIKEDYLQTLAQLNEQQDRKTGNYNRFWDERNYLNQAENIKASVFIVHGLKDWNVKPKQPHLLWSALEKHDVPRKMLLHQGDHIYINNLASIEFSDIMNRWYAHWLYDIDNQVMEHVPNVLIQNNQEVSRWDTSMTWPYAGVQKAEFRVGSTGRLAQGQTPAQSAELVKMTDDLSLTGYERGQEAEQSEQLWLSSLLADPEEKKAFRLCYLTDPLERDARISGEVNLRLSASIDNQQTGILSAMLVDYGESYPATLKLETVREQGLAYGIQAGYEDMVDFVAADKPEPFVIITRGWMNVQNRKSNAHKEEVIPGETYHFSLDLVPMDYTLPQGHRLGLILYSTDVQATARQFKVTEFTIHQESIAVTIPMV